MKNFKYIFAALFIIFSLKLAGFAQVFSFERNPNIKTVTIPAGTLFKGVLQTNLDSASNNIGDKVYLILPLNIKLGEFTCIPKKSLVKGQVVQVQKAKEGKDALIQIKFESIQFPDGWETQFPAHIWNSGGKGILGGERTKKTKYKKVPHYIEDVGIVAQLVESGPEAMGKERKIPVGTEFILVLDNDIKVKFLEKF